MTRVPSAAAAAAAGATAFAATLAYALLRDPAKISGDVAALVTGVVLLGAVGILLAIAAPRRNDPAVRAAGAAGLGAVGALALARWLGWLGGAG